MNDKQIEVCLIPTQMENLTESNGKKSATLGIRTWNELYAAASQL